MYNLRLLKIYNSGNGHKCKLYLPKGLQSLPESLPDWIRYLHWDQYPLKSLPSSFTPHNLIELVLPNSQLHQLWNGAQDLQNLKKINLSSSKYLTQIPDLSKAPNVEIIDPSSCANLLQIPSYFKNLDMLKSLNLSRCSNLHEFPKLPRNIETLYMSETAIKEVPSSIERNQNLQFLCFSGCKELESLSTSISKLKYISRIYLCGCFKLDSFPKILEPMESLVYLMLEEVAIKKLPSSIENLVGLQKLELSMCLKLEFIPENISNLNSLGDLTIRNCPKLKALPALPRYLKKVLIYDCTSLGAVSSSVFAFRKCWDEFNKLYGELFAFYDCPSLDHNARTNIMADALPRVLRMATFASIHGNHIADNLISCPTNDIPPWFSYQSKGSSIKILLPQNWFSSNFLGFAFCVVVDFDNFEKRRNFKLICESHRVDLDTKELMLWDKWQNWTCQDYFRYNTTIETCSPASQVFLFYGYSQSQYYDNLRKKYGVDWSSATSDKDGTLITSFVFLSPRARRFQKTNLCIKQCQNLKVWNSSSICPRCRKNVH